MKNQKNKISKNYKYGKIGNGCIRNSIEEFPNLWAVFDYIGIDIDDWNFNNSFASREKARKYVEGISSTFPMLKYKIVKYQQQN